MRPQSAKAKGRRFQQEIAACLIALFPELEEGDARSLSMGAAGHDILLSPAAERLIPFDFECKNVEKINIWAVIDQMFARDNRAHLGRHPIAVIRKNHTKPLAVFPFGWWFNLVMRHNREPAVLGDRFSFNDIKAKDGSSHALWWQLRQISNNTIDRSQNHADDIVWNVEDKRYLLRLHTKKAMPFWKTVDELMVPARTGIIFNRGDDTAPLMVCVRWSLVEILLKLHNMPIVDVTEQDIEWEGDPYPEVADAAAADEEEVIVVNDD